MKKILSLFLAATITSTVASAFSFPEPDWGALLEEKRKMVYETDFELYCEAPVSSAPYFGAKFEPQGGTYFGIIAENSEFASPVGSYLTFFSLDDRQTDIYYPANNIIRENNSIVTIGYTLNSLDNIDYGVIRESLDTIASYNKPTLIRFASEMNVSSLGDDPARYIEVFRTVANMIHEYPNLAVVWSPNDMGALDRPFEYFYPGDEYVDWIGVSSYMKKYFLGKRDTLDKEAIYFMTGDYAFSTNALKPIVKFMNDNGINKPIMISEGGVATDNKYGEDMEAWATPRFRNMYYNTLMKYPQVKIINYFNTYRTYEDEKFHVKDYHNQEAVDKPYAMQILNEAASSGAYIREYGDTPDFVFGKVNDGYELTAENGLVSLYTLAYIPKKPDITVNYTLDGNWYHSVSAAPYKCSLGISGLSDGAHTLTISAEDVSKSYTFYKRGNIIRFGSEPALPSIAVTVNGNALTFDTQPTVIDSRVLVPIRVIFNALGAEVDWDSNTQSAIAIGRGHNVNIGLGKDFFTKDGTIIPLDVPAQSIDGRILVPVRAISQAFDCHVDWDNATQCVVITD